MSELHGVITDEQAAAMRARNEARAKAAIEALGGRWAGHPLNSPKSKKDAANADAQELMARLLLRAS